ncbi:MAG TPA: AAA family ATPase [Rhodocyclaceae bacterium]|nr:AAA family ATPase [Rhodocyclaceae bacterium]
MDEWKDAELAPPCIVEGLLYADVGVRVAAGGMGKTTLELFEAVHIVLGRPLYGRLRVPRPGRVVIVTAEDGRWILVARLREICKALELTADEIARVMDGIRIADLSARPAKITAIVDDIVAPNYRVDEIIDACRPHPPVLVVFDPAISFGVGERRVNDAEQALVEAGRRIRAALGCAVKFIHHSGQVSAREKLIDQYAGRGGTAFADGCRMVHVLQSLSPEEFRTATGRTLDDGETGLILARPKLSYCPPQPPLYLVRRGYLFRAVEPDARDPGAELAAICNQVEQLIGEKLRDGRYPTQRSLDGEAKSCNLARQQMRDAVAILKSSGRIETRKAPSAEGRGGTREYLALSGAPKADGAPNGKYAA